MTRLPSARAGEPLEAPPSSARVHQRILDRVAKMSPDDLWRVIVDAGVYTPGGKLAPEYGGQDLPAFRIALPGSTSPADVDLLLRSARAQWPRGVVSGGRERTVRSIDDALKGSRSAVCEFFLYETREFYDSWAAHGLTEANAAHVLFVLVEKGGGFLAVGEENSGAHRLATDTLASLKNHRPRTLPLDFPLVQRDAA